MLAREVQLEFLEHKDIGQSQEIGFPSSGISVNPIVKILRSEYLEENLTGVFGTQGGQTQESGFPSSGLSLVFNIICVQFSSQG